MNDIPQKTFQDAELVNHIKSGNELEIRKFIVEYQDKIFRLCMQYMRNEDEAYDMVQEVFLTMLEKIDNFKGESKLSTWLYSITVFTCIGQLRKKKKKFVSSLDEPALNEQNKLENQILTSEWINQTVEQVYNPQENLVLRDESMNLLMKEIHDLPADYKTVFILKELENLSIKEIQKTVPISISAIKTRLHRARLFLRNRLTDYYSEYQNDK